MTHKKYRKRSKRNIRKIASFIVAAIIVISAFVTMGPEAFFDSFTETSYDVHNVSSLTEIPVYEGEAYVTVNNNEPEFTNITTEEYEAYSQLDYLGRCGPAEACIGRSLMPTEERTSIGMIKPSGWHTVRYDCVDGKYLYNRAHLIAYMLTGENANEDNLITGTRQFNLAMLPFEEQVHDYINETGNHVLYRVTPIFEGENLVASGVQMQAKSIEDDTISFNVYVFNVQEGVVIDYKTGDSYLAD